MRWCCTRPASLRGDNSPTTRIVGDVGGARALVPRPGPTSGIAAASDGTRNARQTLDFSVGCQVRCSNGCLRGRSSSTGCAAAPTPPCASPATWGFSWALDILCLGRTASRRTFTADSPRHRLAHRRDGRLLWHEQAASKGLAPAGFAGGPARQPVTGTCWVAAEASTTAPQSLPGRAAGGGRGAA